MSKGTILIVEKDAFYASFYEKLLAKEGYRVFLAGSVADGLRLFGEREYDAVIADMVIGAEDGLTLLRAVKAARPRQDVVMITSMQSLKKAVEALKAGAADYLTKPVDGEELLLLLRTLIDRQTIRDEHARLAGENLLFAERLRVARRGLDLLAMLDIDRIMDHLLDLAVEETGAVWAALFLRREEEDDFVFAARRGIHDPRLERPGFAFTGAALREQFLQGRTLLEDAAGHQAPAGSGATGRRMLVPLRHAGRTAALMLVGPRRDDAPHGDRGAEVAAAVAESGAIALANARAFALEAGRDIRDPVSGTYSPVYFHQAGEKEVNIAHRYGRQVSAVCVQLDGYAAAKAALKEAQCRKLLREFAGKLLEVARETDVVAMLEEGLFGIVVPETDYYGAIMLIKRLRIALRGASFSPDLTRVVRLTASMGAASYPRDGEQLVTILRRARERLALDRESVVRRVGLEQRPFWEAFDYLLARETAADRDPALENGFVSLATDEVERIRNLFLEEVARLGPVRGLVYVGAQTVDSATFAFSGFSRLAGSKTSVFCLGARGGGGWNHPEITPVYLDDRRVAESRFLLCIAEGCYYSCLCRPDGEGRWRAFHSADPFLVQELVAKLQERYQLQQRIG